MTTFSLNLPNSSYCGIRCICKSDITFSSRCVDHIVLYKSILYLDILKQIFTFLINKILTPLEYYTVFLNFHRAQRGPPGQNNLFCAYVLVIHNSIQSSLSSHLIYINHIFVIPSTFIIDTVYTAVNNLITAVQIFSPQYSNTGIGCHSNIYWNMYIKNVVIFFIF